MIRIFYADDDSEDCDIFRDAIKAVVQQSEITCLMNGVELFDRLQHTTPLPQYLFLDLNMPVFSGVDCLKEIKNNPLYKNIMIIIVSTSASETDVQSAFEHGASYFICKPSSLVEYEILLAKVFNKKFNTQPPFEEFRIL